MREKWTLLAAVLAVACWWQGIEASKLSGVDWARANQKAKKEVDNDQDANPAQDAENAVDQDINGNGDGMAGDNGIGSGAQNGGECSKCTSLCKHFCITTIIV